MLALPVLLRRLPALRTTSGILAAAEVDANEVGRSFSSATATSVDRFLCDIKARNEVELLMGRCVTRTRTEQSYQTISAVIQDEDEVVRKDLMVNDEKWYFKASK